MTVETTTGTTTALEVGADKQLRLARQQVVSQLADRVPAAQVEEVFEQVLHEFDGAPVRTYVGVLAARGTRERLRRAAAS